MQQEVQLSSWQPMQEQQAGGNPYWDAVVAYFARTYQYAASWAERAALVRKYAWAIPDPETLDVVLQWLGPRAVEMGAGTGYWAAQLYQRSGQALDLLAFDQCPPHLKCNEWFNRPFDADDEVVLLPSIFYSVREGTPEVLDGYADRTLFLCWPPYSADLAYECLQHYTGPRLIYIGEGEDGCTGSQAFFDVLRADWHMVANHIPVQWDGLHDEVFVYERGSEEQCVIDSESTPPPRLKRGSDSFPSLLRALVPELSAVCRWLDLYVEEQQRCSEGLLCWLRRVNPTMAKKYSSPPPFRRLTRKQRRSRNRAH